MQEQCNSEQNKQHTVEERKTLDSIEKLPISYFVGDIIRLKIGNKVKIWKVTGNFIGGLNHENLIALKSLTDEYGSAYGIICPETIVPQDLLLSNKNIEKL